VTLAPLVAAAALAAAAILPGCASLHELITTSCAEARALVELECREPAEPAR
jgi:hypothetical protein